MGVFQQVVRPVILGAAQSSRMRRAAEQIPVTRKVVDRFVAGETVPEAMDAVAQLRDSSRTVTIDYLGEDTTKVEDADATVRAYLDLLDALGKRGEAANTKVRRWRYRSSCRLSVKRCPATARRSRWRTPTPSASEPRASGHG